MITRNCTEQVLQNSNERLAKCVLEEIISQGISEFCFCPGGRTAPLLYPLANCKQAHTYYWPEERSAAFFALGRIKATGLPVAVITTSGTAAAEILPAAMEAYYTGLPLVLITTDRPRRFRGTGAPQSAEQVGLFSCYVHEMQDLAEEDECHLDHWTCQGPIHINVCFEEPNDSDCRTIQLDTCEMKKNRVSTYPFFPDECFLSFLQKSRFPLVVVGALHPSQHAGAVQFLLHLGAPVYLEGISGIRENPKLEALRITTMERVWHFSAQHNYPIDGILRIGSVPTTRLWRDLEHKKGQILVHSITDLPFSGLSGAHVEATSLNNFFAWGVTLKILNDYPFSQWKRADHLVYQALLTVIQNELLAEQSLIHALSKKIPRNSKVYLGNSLPIREWDMAATFEPRGYQMFCSRGVNGIDGQVATFLGCCTEDQDNWAILGDLTFLYDLVGPWISSQLPNISTNVVVINNGGAGIFSRMFAHPAFQNSHNLSFRPIADFWKWRYERWESIPETIAPSGGGRLIEIVPNPESTQCFIKSLSTN